MKFISAEKEAQFNSILAERKAEKDAYSVRALEYGIQWADLMEGEISKLQGPPTVPAQAILCHFFHKRADALSKIADVDGITGFMFGIAASLIADCWVYGKDFVAWHNTQNACSEESAKEYTEAGQAVNPALIEIRERPRCPHAPAKTA